MLIAAILLALSGEATAPLRTVPVPPFALKIPARPLLQRVIPVPAASPVAAGNGVAYYQGQNATLQAIDLRHARVLWRQPAGGFEFAASDGAVYYQDPKTGALVARDSRNGKVRFTIPKAKPAGSVRGALFAQQICGAYRAHDPSNGELLWSTLGGGMAVNGGPVIRGDFVLQPFVDDGAIIENVLYAFDRKTGDAQWSHRSAGLPLGYRQDVVYLDSTWLPDQMDNYVPMTIDAVNIVTGRRLDSFTYAPDPEVNATTYRNAPRRALVGGAYVYLEVNGTWYRYDADREPSAAHPMHFSSGINIDAVFQNGDLILDDERGVYIGYMSSDHVDLQRLRSGALKSAVVEAQDGTRYAVAGDTLLALSGSEQPRAIGSVRCSNVAAIVPWPGYVAVLCGAPQMVGATELLFADATYPAPPLGIPKQTPPPYVLRLDDYPIPLPASGFDRQWRMSALAPLTDNGVAFALNRGSMNSAGSIGFMTSDGRFSSVPLGSDLRLSNPPRIERRLLPASPTQIAADKHGNVWFNNAWWPTLGELRPDGTITMQTAEEEPQGNMLGRYDYLPVAVGPDGEAWFARSRPQPQIGRADGSFMYDIPAEYGPALRLLHSDDGGLWFLTRTHLGRVTENGAFTGTELPPELRDSARGVPLMANSLQFSVRVALGSTIYWMSENGMVGNTPQQLPDRTLSVNDMVKACDGSLYIAENVPELVRKAPDGSVQRYSTGSSPIDRLAVTPDCSIWYARGTNYPHQSVGKLRLVPR